MEKPTVVIVKVNLILSLKESIVKYFNLGKNVVDFPE